jgi:hypothetical protein
VPYETPEVPVAYGGASALHETFITNPAVASTTNVKRHLMEALLITCTRGLFWICMMSCKSLDILYI